MRDARIEKDVGSDIRALPILKKSRPSTGFGRLIKTAHAAVARDIGYCLTLGDRDGWRGFTTVIRARLAPGERAELARAALMACDDTDLAMIFEAARDDGAGPPVASFDDVAEEARLWAEWASPEEASAYAVACLFRMTPHDRDAFVAFAQRRAAA
jgi:hypothetical protein